MDAGRAGTPLAALRQVVRARPVPAGARCDLCAAPVGPEHPHVADLRGRSLLCGCRPCWLLFDGDRVFDGDRAGGHYRAVPERYLSFPGLTVDARAWDELRIPVGLAFLFRDSVHDRTVAFYPGPAGATESELPMDAWADVNRRHPALSVPRPDVEALLVRRPAGDCWLVPIDACYQLTGELRGRWRGFDGGREARDAVDAFFARVRARAVPAAGPP